MKNYQDIEKRADIDFDIDGIVYRLMISQFKKD